MQLGNNFATFCILGTVLPIHSIPCIGSSPFCPITQSSLYVLPLPLLLDSPSHFTYCYILIPHYPIQCCIVTPKPSRRIKNAIIDVMIHTMVEYPTHLEPRDTCQDTYLLTLKKAVTINLKLDFSNLLLKACG